MSSSFERLRARLDDFQNLAYEAVSTVGGIVDEAIATVEEYVSKVEDKTTPVYNVNVSSNREGPRAEGFGLDDPEFKDWHRQYGLEDDVEDSNEEPEQGEAGGSEEERKEPSLQYVLTVVRDYLLSNDWEEDAYRDETLYGLVLAEDFLVEVKHKARTGEKTYFEPLWPNLK